MQGGNSLRIGWLENRVLSAPCQHPVGLLATISHTLHAVGTGK